MFAGPTRQIIIADGDPSRLGWLVEALREAGHAVFPVSDGEGVVSIARALSHVDLLLASRDTPTVSGCSFDQLISNRLEDVAVVYWDPHAPTRPAELEEMFSG